MASRAFELTSSVGSASRWGRLAVVLAATAVPLAGGGCERDAGRADKAVDQKVNDAQALAGGSMTDELNVAKTLDEIKANLTGASDWQKARTQGLRGDNEMRLAQGYAAQAEFYTRHMEQLTIDIGRMAAAVAASDADAAAMLRRSPEKVLADLKERSAAVAGSADKQTWIDTKAGSLTSLAADDKAAADLKAEVDRLGESIKTQTAERDQLLAAADQQADQSNRERGDAAVSTYTQSSDARKKAADLNVKIDADTVALGRAQADLDGATKQQDAKHEAIKRLDAAQSGVAADWKAVQERAEASKTAVAAVLGKPVTVQAAALPDPLTLDADAAAANKAKLASVSGGSTISSKAAMLQALGVRAHGLRSQAETHFNAALGFYREAIEAAKNLQIDTANRINAAGASERADYQAFVDLRRTVHPGFYTYLRASADTSKAEFFARSAAEARMQIEVANRLQPAVEAAGLTAPAGLDAAGVATLTTQQTSAEKSARDAFKDAIDQFTKLPEGGDATAEVKDGAKVGVIFANYGLSALEAAAGGTGTTVTAPFDLAKEKARVAISAGTYLPPLPADLASAVRFVPPPVTPITPGKPTPAAKPATPAKPPAKTPAK